MITFARRKKYALFIQHKLFSKYESTHNYRIHWESSGNCGPDHVELRINLMTQFGWINTWFYWQRRRSSFILKRYIQHHCDEEKCGCFNGTAQSSLLNRILSRICIQFTSRWIVKENSKCGHHNVLQKKRMIYWVEWTHLVSRITNKKMSIIYGDLSQRYYYHFGP